MFDYSKLREAIIEGEVADAGVVAQRALDGGASPLELIEQGVGPAMNEVGRQFEEGDCFVPELLMAARATKAVFELLRPLLAGTGAKPTGRVVIGTIQGDLHDIGKNLVAALLEGNGFEVVDLGVDVSAARFVAAVQEERPHIVGLSALLTTTMPAMKKAIDELEASGVRDRVKVMVGGAPVTQQFADSIGADAFGTNAVDAVERARSLMFG